MTAIRSEKHTAMKSMRFLRSLVVGALLPLLAFGAANDLQFIQVDAGGVQRQRVVTAESAVGGTLASYRSALGLGAEDSPTFAGISVGRIASLTSNGLVTTSGGNGTLGVTAPGTGVLTALGVNIGTAGSVVVNGGALGTPSGGTLTNATGLPISTGVAGLGSGVATALAAAPDATGGVVTFSGNIGNATGTSLTGPNLTNITISGGSSGATIELAQGANASMTFTPKGAGSATITRTNAAVWDPDTATYHFRLLNPSTTTGAVAISEFGVYGTDTFYGGVRHGAVSVNNYSADYVVANRRVGTFYETFRATSVGSILVGTNTEYTTAPLTSGTRMVVHGAGKTAAFGLIAALDSDGTKVFSIDGTGAAVLAGSVTSASATAIPAGGTAGVGYKFSSTANFGVFFGSGAPTLSAAKGSMYLRSDGTTTNDRAYINTDGGTTWTALTTGA